ncbi:MAG: hypothetical protein FWD16_07350 [Clostridia bacterium]|nr:hypothetical protein [Clostridia bacterium]
MPSIFKGFVHIVFLDAQLMGITWLHTVARVNVPDTVWCHAPSLSHISSLLSLIVAQPFAAWFSKKGWKCENLVKSKHRRNQILPCLVLLV